MRTIRLDDPEQQDHQQDDDHQAQAARGCHAPVCPPAVPVAASVYPPEGQGCYARDWLAHLESPDLLLRRLARESHMRLSYLALPATLLAAALALSAPLTIDRPAKTPPAIEKMLHGAWKGEGACQGDIRFNADGTFARQNFGPANAGVAGTWIVRWDGLPPTLVLTCTHSTLPDYVGNVTEVKVVELGDDTFAYKWADKPHLTKFTRSK
jgi:hypothetical protein